MADASNEPKLAQTETEKPLHGDEKAAEAPKATPDTPASVSQLFFKPCPLRSKDR
jgi:Ran-binding protein 1